MSRIAAVLGLLVLAACAAAAGAPQPRLDRPYAVALRGQVAYVGGEGGRVIRVDLRTRRARLVARGLGVITGVALDARGNLYVADFEGGRILRIDPRGRRTVRARLPLAADVAVSAGGDLYVPTLRGFVYKVERSGRVIRLAGTGPDDPESGDGGPATEASVGTPHGIAVDRAGNVYFPTKDRIRRIDARSGVIDTIATRRGLGVKPALARDGTIYITAGDPSGGTIVAVRPGGSTRVVAGNGRLRPARDGRALRIGLLPGGLALAPDGSLVFTQVEPRPALRRLDLRAGTVTTLFG